jgi:uncharacterized protein YceH (UPF0502 family)
MYQGLNESNIGHAASDYANNANAHAPARMPEVQREHEGLMAELGAVSKLLAELTQRLSPVRAEKPTQTAANHVAGVHPVAPVTEIGQRIRAAQQEVGGLRQRLETLLSEVEV